ncbi:hypothetical protein [Streptomyces sp. NPDC051561]|uniref:hypothetical protein n=1 Tax=Streptomyces sp. NPDC051561 TaxID=3365658 RepID=UPI0037928DED
MVTLMNTDPPAADSAPGPAPSSAGDPGPGPSRHCDTGGWLARYSDRIQVVCPRCGGRAVVVPRPGVRTHKYFSELLFQPRRLACGGCGAVAEWAAGMRGNALIGVSLGGTEDPFFGRPLWLQVRCAGRMLWAYNEEQVEELARYAGAQLRERGAGSSNASMISRLPAWMKRGENRPEVLAGLAALRELAGRSAPADRSDAAYEHGVRPHPHGSLYFRGGAYEVE